jgi:hypothetical protein
MEADVAFRPTRWRVRSQGPGIASYVAKTGVSAREAMKDLGGRRPRHRVVGLVDAEGVVRHIGVASADRPPIWNAVWAHRHELESQLAIWLRQLAAEPREVVLLGGAVALHAGVATATAKMLRRLFDVPSEEEAHCQRRVVVQVDGEKHQVWPSISAAARDLGVTRPTILRYIQRGRLLDGGCH